MSALIGAPAHRGESDDVLCWSEYGFVLAVLLAEVITVDPFNWGLASRTLLKHLPLALAVVFAALSAVGDTLRTLPEARSQVRGPVATAWPLLVLAALIVGGSLYERFLVGVRDTFLNDGLYMLMVFPAASIIWHSRAPTALLRSCFVVLVGAGVVMGMLLIRNFGVRQVYHEQIFLVIPLAVVFFTSTRRTGVRWIGCGFFLAMSWFSQKYTSYLVGALTVIYLLAMVALPRTLSRHSALRRVSIIYWTVLLLLACAAVVGAVMLVHRAELPTGNPGYRLYTYAEAWHRFTESPLWGTLFVAEAVRKFSLFTVGVAHNLLPTHSDVLDLLANGGLLAVSLWAVGLARIARVAQLQALAPRFLDTPAAPYAHALAMISIAGTVTYAFNPILLQPPKAFLLWTCLGLLLGLAVRMGRDAVPMRRHGVPPTVS